MRLEVGSASAAYGAAVGRAARTREGGADKAVAARLRDAAELATAVSRSGSQQSDAVEAAGRAGSAELSAVSAGTPDRAVPKDQRELAAAGVRVEPKHAAARCTSLVGALPESCAEEACCEAGLVAEDAQTLGTSLRGRVPGCAGSEAAVPITVRDIVSEWLVNGHEVVTVRQGSARAHVLAHALVHAAGGDIQSRR